MRAHPCRRRVRESEHPHAAGTILNAVSFLASHNSDTLLGVVWGRPTMRLRPGSSWLEYLGPGRRGLHLIHRKEIDRYPRRHLDPGGLGREDHEDGALLSYHRTQLALLCPPSRPRLLLQRTLPRRPTGGVHPPAHRRILNLSAARGCKGIYPGTGASPRVGIGLSLSLCLCCAA